MNVLQCILFFYPQKTPLGGLSLFQPDWMHCKCLGTDSYLAGSVLAFMATEILPEQPEENIAFLWELIQAQYTQLKTKCRLSRLTWKMVKHQPLYKLSAKTVETRDLLPALVAILAPWVADNPIVEWFQRLLLLSSRLDQLVFGNPTMWLTMQERRSPQRRDFSIQPAALQASMAFSQLGETLLQLHNQKSLPLPYRVACL